MKLPISLTLWSGNVCNLNCPNCPVGIGQQPPAGFMIAETADDILRKIESQRHVKILNVCLWGWNEPFLNKELPELVRTVHSYGLDAFISSNLNVWANVEQTLSETPELITISVSGFTRPIYDVDHPGGDIERVKRNMVRLANCKSPFTAVRVVYHQYLYNQHEEEPMRRLATSLGFDFQAYEATILPVSRLIREWSDPNNNGTGRHITSKSLSPKWAFSGLSPSAWS